LHAGATVVASLPLTQRTQKRHMNGKIKTGREAFGFRHQLTAERQGLFPSRGVKTGSGF
jgi:hypothetical protein